jgi:hypothetical protein
LYHCETPMKDTEKIYFRRARFYPTCVTVTVLLGQLKHYERASEDEGGGVSRSHSSVMSSSGYR